MRAKWSETDRLAALRSYDVLDTPTEATFRDFVQVAAHVCEAPIAVVNFVDENRQWFAAEQGLGVRETPLDVSICAHAILQPGVFVVPDLSEDDRFDCNPLVTGEPRLRFYAGALLETPDRLPLGTLCVLDYVPRPKGLTAPQTFTLEALARQVMTHLELRRALRQRTEAEAEKAALLAEKDLLVQEVHHRVKNSLSTVQSLLLLQARTTTDDDVAQPLRESAARVQVFGTMHEHLYRIGAASHVEIATYLRSLVDDQRAAFASGPSPRTITLEADKAQWPSSEAPALGMIVVELVTNALKYGEGTVRVTLRTSADEVVLTVEDEGRGLPPDFEPTKGRGLGMRVVTGLLRTQGRGHLEIDRSRPGTAFVARLRTPSHRLDG
jgi:two-component sensor histidine kinase